MKDHGQRIELSNGIEISPSKCSQFYHIAQYVYDYKDRNVESDSFLLREEELDELTEALHLAKQKWGKK